MKSIKVKIKKLNPKAAIPTQAREGDFCYDVVAVSKKRIAWRTWEYGIGLAYEIVRDDISVGSHTEYVQKWDAITDWRKYDPKHCTWPDGYEKVEVEQLIDKYSYNNIKLDIDFRPRSSVHKTGMMLSNCVGTLDEFYRGEMKAVFYNFNPFKKNYKVGDKIGQIKLGFTLPLEFEIVDEINMNTERGTGGFGSTDIKE